jgi:hypothetical protein
MNHEAFRSGNFDTQFVGNYFNADSLDQKNEKVELAAALASTILQSGSNGQLKNAIQNETISNWKKNRTAY